MSERVVEGIMERLRICEIGGNISREYKVLNPSTSVMNIYSRKLNFMQYL